MRVKKFVKMKVKGSDGRWKNTDYSVREDGVLLNTYGNENAPIFVGQDFVDAGLALPKVDLDWDEYSTEEQNLALTINHERVELTPESREIIEKWLSGEEDREKERMARLNDKNNQNAFLKSKGYRWEKRGVYHSNPGELIDAWFLLGPDGEVVCGWKDSISEELASTGPSLETLLTELGYYGQEAIDELKAKNELHQKCMGARAKVDAYFENAVAHSPTPELEERSLSLISISDVSRTRYAITEEGIWQLIYNGMDGDDWSHNNYSMYIASRYDYNADIAEAIAFLSS